MERSNSRRTENHDYLRLDLTGRKISEWTSSIRQDLVETIKRLAENAQSNIKTSQKSVKDVSEDLETSRDEVDFNKAKLFDEVDAHYHAREESIQNSVDKLLVAEANSKEIDNLERLTDLYLKLEKIIGAKATIAIENPNKLFIPRQALNELLDRTAEAKRDSNDRTDNKFENEYMQKRFSVALSFPGDHRDFVEPIADDLVNSLGRDRVFYDRNFEHELSRPNLDTYLQEIYHCESELITVFICNDYEKKDWCHLEWRAIRDLIKKRRDDEVMFIRVDSGEVSGIFSVDGYIDGTEKSPQEIAALIERRLDLVRSI